MAEPFEFVDFTDQELVDWLADACGEWNTCFYGTERRDYDDVDDYLDHLTDEGQALYREIMHLRYELEQRGWTREQIVLHFG